MGIVNGSCASGGGLFAGAVHVGLMMGSLRARGVKSEACGVPVYRTSPGGFPLLEVSSLYRRYLCVRRRSVGLMLMPMLVPMPMLISDAGVGWSP